MHPAVPAGIQVSHAIDHMQKGDDYLTVYKVSRTKSPDTGSGRFITSYRVDQVQIPNTYSQEQKLPEMHFYSLVEAIYAMEEMMYPIVNIK